MIQQTQGTADVLKYPNCRTQTLRREINNGKPVYTLTSNYTTKDGLKYSVSNQLNEQEFNERQKYNGGVLEIENEDIINAVSRKPKATSLKQLREIKLLRLQNARAEPEIILSPFFEDLKNVSSVRGINRENAFKELALKLHGWFMEKGYSVVSYEQFSLLFSGFPDATKKRLRSDLIKTLLSLNLITAQEGKKFYKTYDITQLFSYEKFNNKGVLIDCVGNGNLSIYRKRHADTQKIFILI